MARVQVGEKWGLLDTNGHLAVKPIYDEIAALTSGIRQATLRSEGRFEYLDEHGTIVKTPTPFCPGYRDGVFLCTDGIGQIKDGQQLLLAMAGLKSLTYYTRSGRRIGGVNFAELGK